MIHKYLFTRKGFDGRPRPVTVEGVDKDHALQRLIAEYPWTHIMDWDFIDELDPDHFVGAFGVDLPPLSRN